MLVFLLLFLFVFHLHLYADICFCRTAKMSSSRKRKSWPGYPLATPHLPKYWPSLPEAYWRKTIANGFQDWRHSMVTSGSKRSRWQQPKYQTRDYKIQVHRPMGDVMVGMSTAFTQSMPLTKILVALYNS